MPDACHCRDKQLIASIFNKIREEYPTTLGGVKVRSVRDATTGFDNAYADKKSRLPIQVRDAV